MDLSKKAKTFVRLIAKELVKKHPDRAFLDGNIRKLFNAAVSSIQDKELSLHLNNYGLNYVILLGRLVNELQKVEMDRENQETLPSQLPFNCYQAGQSQVRKAAVRVLPVEEQLQVYIQDLVNKLHEDGSQEKLNKSLKNFKKCLKKEVKESPMDATFSILASTNSTIAVAPEIKPKMMKLYLRGMEPVVKKCLAEQDVIRAANMQRKVHSFLMWSQVMKSENETMESQQAGTAVKADIMRNYLELVLLSYRPSSPGELRNLDTQLYSFVTYVLDLSEPCILDILMRLKSINGTNHPVLESLIRFCLLPLPMLSDKEQAQQCDEYLRYTVAVAKLAAPLPSLRSIVENALSVPAPKGTVNYLSGRVDLSEWPTHKKFKGLMVTQFLLKEASESIISEVAKMLLEMDRGGVPMEEGSTETASQPLFFIDSGPGPSTQHMSMEVDGRDAIEDVEEAPSEGEEEAKSAASRQKKKRPPKPQESEGMDNDGEGQEDPAQGTSSQSNIIEDSAPQVFDLSTIDFSNFSKQSFPGVLCSEKLEVLKRSGIGTCSPSKSPASPEKPNGINLRNGGGLAKFDEAEEEDVDSGAEFSEKMVILGLSDNSDKEEISPREEKKMAKSSKRKVTKNQKPMISKEEDEQEEEIEKQEGKDGENGKEELESKLHQKPTRRKGRQNSTRSVPSSDLESGLESMKLASPRKSQRQRKMSGLSSISNQLDAQDNSPEESLARDIPSSPVIPSQVPNLRGLSTRKTSRRKSPSMKNGSSQETEPEAAKSPLRPRHRNVSGTSTTSKISVREEEGSSTVNQRSLRKRTFSSSSLGSNLSDADPKGLRSEAKVRARPRSRKTEVLVQKTLIEEAEEVEEVNENDADSIASGPPKPARRGRKSGKQGTQDVGETKEVKTAASAKKASDRPAVTPGLKRYSLRSGQH